MFKLVLVIYAILGPSGSAVPMQVTTLPGTYTEDGCKQAAASYRSIVSSATDARIGGLCIAAGSASEK
jgi:hypothetical protein